MNMRWDLTISVLLSCLILSPVFGYDLPAIVESMGSKHECEQYPREIHWISEKTSALVIGKSRDSVRVCRLKFGLATAKTGARLRLSFDFIYNHACGVYLQINESFTSDFHNSTTSREMFMSGCNTRDPGPLFAQPKHFILVSLVKENEKLEAYNFRLNISMAENLPARGPELHVVIIVGFVLFTVVVLAAILLFKFVNRLSYHWQEQPVGNPINIYNSQEHLPEPDRTYVRPVGNAKSQALGSQIAFVHSDGRVERFRPPNGATVDKREFINRRQAAAKPQARPNSQVRQNSHEPQNPVVVERDEPSSSFQPDLESVSSPCAGTEIGDTVSLEGFDFPPSYEEALGMPLAGDVENSADEDDLNVAIGGRLELDYCNVGNNEEIVNTREIVVGEGKTSGNCDGATFT